jgi:serine protease Do
MRRIVITRSVVVLALVASACAVEGRADAGTTPAQAKSATPQQKGAPAANTPPATSPSGDKLWREAQGGQAVNVPTQGSLAPLIKQLKPGVVNISSTTVVKNPHRGLRRGPGGQGMPPGGGGDEGDDPSQLFERFFGQREMPEELRGTSLGSGFVINDVG